MSAPPLQSAGISPPAASLSCSTFSTALRRSPLPLPGAVDPAAPALVGHDGPLDHGSLRRRVDDLAATMPSSLAGRLLVHVPLSCTVESVVAYLGVLEAGHSALVSASDPGAYAALTEAWPVDLEIAGGRVRRVDPWNTTPRQVLHPDLAVLLSTSGSTGSPKLVRLSHANLASNAEAIAAALGITGADRGITSLPLHYCFGLSVLHSHLTVGASITLTDASVLDPDFWTVVNQGVTTLAVVPHMIELMETTGILERTHPTLRLITQAGGRMAPERVTRTARLGREHGWGLSVMYGQTEATARICIHDPAEVLTAPDAVGRPVPGTTIVLDTSVPEADRQHGTGEIIVRGPGVMMGYAHQPQQLADGPVLTELRTGDLGRLDDGVLRIVGRRSGFVKVAGLRIDLAGIEAVLERDGFAVCVTGDDGGLRVAVEPVPGRGQGELAGSVRRAAARASGIGVAHVRVAVHPLPRRSNGKVDRARSDAQVRAIAQDAQEQPPTGDDPAARVAATVATLLGRDAVDLRLSFAAQGGDSLAHVQASVRLAELVGELPPDWHRRPLSEIVDLGQRRADIESATAEGHGRPWSRLRRRLGGRAGIPVETSVLLRAIAVLTILGTHAGLFHLQGGAHTLLAVAGFNAARFGLSAATVRDRWRGTARLFIGLAVPTMLIALVGVSSGRYGWDNVFFVHWLAGDIAHDTRNELWFIDALLACVLVTTALLSVPAVSRRWQADPWRVAFALVLAGLIPRFVVLTFAEGVLHGIMPTVFWIFAVGLALAYADTAARRSVTLGAALLGIAWFFPDQPLRNAVVLGGIALLALVPTIRLPRPLIPGLTALGAASLHIYLIQFQLLGRFSGALITVTAAIAAGLVFWWLTARPVRRLQDLIPSSRGQTLVASGPSRTARCEGIPLPRGLSFPE